MKIGAPAWVLLRGLAREAGHWGDFAGQLQERLGDEGTVIALDLPGNGALHGQRSPSTVIAMVGALREDLRRRAVAGPYRLVAMSLGGMVALQWAHESPQELAGCVLINTSVRGHGAFWQRLQPHNYATLLGVLRPWQTTLQRETAILQVTSSHPARHASVVGAWAALASQHPVSPGNAVRQLLAAARYRPPATKPAVPMLVLTSEGDRLVSPACSRQLAAAFSLPLRVHPDAGHDLPLDDPDWVITQLTGPWLV